RLALAPDGRTLAVVEGDALILLDGATGKELRRADPADGIIADLSFSADGRVLTALLSGPTRPAVCPWDGATGKRVVRPAPNEKAGGDGLPIHTAIPSNDGRLLATINLLNQVHLWETASGRRLTQFVVRDAVSAAFSPDARLLAVTTSNGT